MHDPALLIVFAVFTFCAYFFKMGWFRSIEAADTKDRLVFQYRLKEVYVSRDDMSFVGFDFQGQKMVLGAGIQDTVYDFAQIAYVEIIENEIARTATNRANQMLGDMSGGLVFGNESTLVLAGGGSLGSRGRIQSLALKVFVDNRASHSHTISFFRSRSRKGVDPDHYRVKDARTQVALIYAQVLRAMEQECGQPVACPSASGSSESRMLPEMKQTGTTGEEFAL